MNEQIRVASAAVIDDEGKQLGVMRVEDALSLAREKELDLVEVSPHLNPPVCKIMDYGKYTYKIAKQKRQQIAKQKKIETKEVRLSVRTDVHDLDFKAKNAVKFLDKGHKVKIDLILKGREKAHIDLARSKMEKFLQIIKEMAKSNQATKDKEISTVSEINKTPQGFNAVIEFKRAIS